MSIYKSVPAKAPYNHQTFNNNNNLLVGGNGVLAGGLVTTSGSAVTIQPLSWIQNGLIVTSDQPLTGTLPPSFSGTYFIAVTSSSDLQNTAEVITPTFVKRPEDVSAGTVLVAEWDGQEWRQLPLLSSEGIVQGLKTKTIVEGLVGISSGFDITQDSSHIYITPGAANATDGSLVAKQVATTLTKVAVDADGLDRIDEVVLRKPADSPTRIAALQYLVAPTFNAGGTVQLFTTKSASAVATQAARILNSLTSDALYLFVGEGTSPSVTLKYLTAPNATTTPTAVGTIATGVDTYDAILNPDGSIDIVYVKGTNLYYQRISVLGVSIYAEVAVYTNLSAITNPKLVSVSSGSGYFLHVVFERVVSLSQRQIGYVRLSSANTVETTFQVLVDLSATLKNPSLAKDDDDAVFFLAFENQDTGAAFLRTYDTSTVTATSPPLQVGLPITLQDNTYDLSTSMLLATTGATNPVVRHTANKETYVFWRHNKGSGVYGIAVYNANYINTFGYKALVKDLYAPSENVDQFYVSTDALGTAHFLLREAGAAGAVNLRLSDFVVSEVQLVLAAACTDVSTKFNSMGSLVHSYGTSTPGTSILKSTAGTITTMRDRYLPPTDVYFAHYRNSDGVISVAGTALEEDPSIRRLYEYGNLFAATGSVTWGGTATHLLVINAALTIHGFNRRSTYTIAANSPGGINIPDGSLCYVNLPDADNGATLTLEVIPFGKGMLDRYGRTAIPLFWSIAGVLYTKFAPYRLEAGGETIIVGQSLTTAERTWLGLPTTPDPTNHAYSSDVYVTQSMDYNEAIGALDAAAAATATELSDFFGQLLLTPHPSITSRVVVSGADITMPDGVVRSEIASSLIMNFAGVHLEFAGVGAGNIYANDDTTVLGTFIMPTIATGEWRWFSITAATGATGGDNRVAVNITVTAAVADGASQSAAVRPTFFTGTPIGAVAINATGVSTVAPIVNSDIVQIGSGSGGGGGGGIPNIAQEVPTYTGTPGQYTTSQVPLNSQSTWVSVSGGFLPVGTAWSLTGSTITFNAGYVPNPATQKVYVIYVVTGTLSIAGAQETPSPAPDGTNLTFNLAGMPSNLASTWVTISGEIISNDQWSLVQSASLSQIVFNPGSQPALGQELYVLYFTPAGASGGGGGGISGAANLGASGVGVYYNQVGNVLNFIKIIAGTNLAWVNNGDGSYTLNASGGSGGREVHGSFAAPITIDPVAGITPTTAPLQVWWVVPNASGIFSTFFNVDGIPTGTQVVLKGASSSNYLTIADILVQPSSNASQNGLVNLTDQQSITYSFDGTIWSEDARRL